MGGKKKGQLVIEARPCGRNVCIRLTDNGQESLREILSKIFDPFFTNQACRTGDWPGVVHLLRDPCSSTKDPAGGEPSRCGVRPSSLSCPYVNGPERSRWRILVVEDEPVIQSLVRRILLRRLRFVIAGCIQEGLSWIKGPGLDPPIDGSAVAGRPWSGSHASVSRPSFRNASMILSDPGL